MKWNIKKEVGSVVFKVYFTAYFISCLVIVLSVPGKYKMLASSIQELKNLAIFKIDK